METVVIVIHLMVIVAMIALVLMQRSEGGALGIGGGGGGNFMTTRGQGNVLTRSTAVLAALFFVTSLGMGILARFNEKPSQILDRVPATSTSQPAAPGGTAPGTGGTILDQLQRAPGSTQQQLPASDGTTLPGTPATPDSPQVPTTQ
jgi:preprotein translocase subunit SecG